MDRISLANIFSILSLQHETKTDLFLIMPINMEKNKYMNKDRQQNNILEDIFLECNSWHLIFKITSQQWVIDFFLGFELHTWVTSFSLSHTIEVYFETFFFVYSFFKIDLNLFSIFSCLCNFPIIIFYFLWCFSLQKETNKETTFCSLFTYAIFWIDILLLGWSLLYLVQDLQHLGFGDKNEECRLQKLEHGMIARWKSESEVAQSCLTLCDPIEGSHPWDFPGKYTGVGCHFLLQGIFPTQGLNAGLPHCR